MTFVVSDDIDHVEITKEDNWAQYDIKLTEAS